MPFLRSSAAVARDPRPASVVELKVARARAGVRRVAWRAGLVSTIVSPAAIFFGGTPWVAAQAAEAHGRPGGVVAVIASVAIALAVPLVAYRKVDEKEADADSDLSHLEHEVRRRQGGGPARD